MPMSRRDRVRRLIGTLLCSGLALGVAGRAQTPSLPQTTLSEQVELPRLIDLCAQRLKINIQYDANELRGPMTLRLGAGVGYHSNLGAMGAPRGGLDLAKSRLARGRGSADRTGPIAPEERGGGAPREAS
mgnify:CR=1 FL=1